MKKIIIVVFILTTLYFIPNTIPVFAQSKILINEFLIDPQPQSVEIFNSGTESANISDWIIDDSGGTTFYTIPKDSIIFPNQCLTFAADFNLNKTSADTVRLINSSQQLIDFFSYKSSSGSGVSYFRLPDSSNNWTTGSANLGFYNQTNISCLTTPTPTQIPTLAPTSTPTSIPTLILISTIGPTISPTILAPSSSPTTYPLQLTIDNIYISEVMVDPITGEKEWIEIYNDNDSLASLNGWYIDDLENAGSSPKIFSLEINAKSYAVYNLTSSMFNNDEDNVRLLDFDKKLKDDFEYSKTEQGKTLGRANLDSDDFCLQEPSKGYVNNSCINPTPTLITPTNKIESSVIIPPTKKVITQKAQTNITQTTPNLTKQNYSYLISPYSESQSSNILGVSRKINKNVLLPDLLLLISASYSLLTISSILFKIKLSYGKDKNFYSSFIRSS